MKHPPGTAEKRNPVAPGRPKKRYASSEGIGLLEESGFPRAVSPEAEQ
jgi:hypothetical protein